MKPCQCPICQSALWAPDSEPLGDRECPRCGALLWFLQFARGPVFFVRRPGQSLGAFVAERIGGRLGLSSDEIDSALESCDALDMVEFVMEIEAAIQLSL